MKNHLTMRILRPLPWFLPLIALMLSCNPRPVDYLIVGARVFDGSLNEPLQLDIGIRQDRIVFTGHSQDTNIRARRVIDASGLFLSPGFIDPHTHAASDLNNLSDLSLQAWLWQGVTTVFEGNDGSSPFPIGEQLDKWEAGGMGVNVGLFVGHGTIRKRVMGPGDRKANEEELQAMCDLVGQAMKEGAFGMSTGLFYAPGSYADTEEIIALARVVAAGGGIYDTHLRDEGSYGIGLLASVREAIEIGERAGVPVHISHIKALGRNAWGQSVKVADLVHEARAKGVQLTANQYPYLASKTSLKAAVVPRWAEDGGNAALMERLQDPGLSERLNRDIEQNIFLRGGAGAIVITTTKHDGLRGRSLQEIAMEMGQDEVAAVKAILVQDASTGIVSFNMQEEDLLHFMKQEWVMTASDGGRGHPRKFGSFPRKMRLYSMEENRISLPEMIHRSSKLTANTLNIRGRGAIRPGFFADLIVFDPQKIQDLASFDTPEVFATGMVYVFVNGQLVIDNGEYNGSLSGRALRLNN